MARKEPSPLSKSRFLAGLQCRKRLWYEVYARQEIPQPPPSRMALFAAGHRVGELAQSLFPGGIGLAPETRSWTAMAAATERLLPQRRPIFEAAFAAAGGACRVDILEPAGESSWNLIEVKMAASVKPTHVQDVAFQFHVLRSVGLNVASASLLQIDTGYVRGEELEPDRLFARVDLTDETDALQAEIAQNLDQLRSELEPQGPPAVPIGAQCSKPYECPLIPVCWVHLEPGNITELRAARGRQWRLYESGRRRLAEVPESAGLTRPQHIQVEAARSGALHLEASKLRRFLERLRPPLSFLDFETANPPIPWLPGTRPFQHIPFQYSLHRQADPDAETSWSGYLATPEEEDPRPQLYTQLRRELQEHGPIVAWNAPVERRILREAAVLGEDWEDWGRAAAARVVDLMEPFAQFAIYHPKQRGSTSLKRVLPALTGEGYEELEIADGRLAAQEFLRLCRDPMSAEEIDTVRARLIEYCRQDTAALVTILDYLQSQVCSAI